MNTGMLLGAASALVLSSGSASAQMGSSSTEEADTLVVVGTRGEARSVANSPSPIDLLRGETVRETGFNDLSKTLQFLAPAINYPRSATAFSSTGTRGVTLRGLTPDQTLVLVNGKRRHASSVLNTNNTVGRGTVPVDLNTIPASAVKRIEILRDGAASQYGSDAIAGVVNIVLRDDPGTRASLQYGQTERGDGETFIVNAATGFEIGAGGNFAVTAELRDRAFTNSAEIDPRFGRVTQRVGDPEQRDINLVADWSVPFGGAEFYGFATFADRVSESAPLFRAPSVAPTIYPDGFLPDITLDMWDVGGTAGLAGEIGGWAWDVSNTVGYDHADFSVENTVNTSLIAVQNPPQTAFESGGARYLQNVANATLTRSFGGIFAGANLAIGVEHRFESYELVAGEPNSYFGAGAQGLPGYSPPEPVDESRNAVSVFADAEIDLTSRLKLAAAGRFENYSDFGSEATWKASALWRPLEFIAFRATASTGFRAPSLQQQHFSSITSQLDQATKLLVNVGTFAVEDPVSLALGASALRAETSQNYSAGIVLTPAPNVTITADYFTIDIDDRISLSESLTGPDVAAALAANGITDTAQVRFFTNAADTTTEGFEATGEWRAGIGAADLNLRVGYGQFDNRLDRLRENPVLPHLPLLNFISLGILLDAQIESKLTAAASLSHDRWSVSVNAARFGDWELPTGQVFGDEILVDLSAEYAITQNISLRAGVINIGDNYPDRVVPDLDGRPYSEGGGLGGDGREYFIRLSASL